ncbi:MAG: hypothetical protein GXY14_13165 [Spirochaetes bacterium]|nr:hypothetical protein [Spirochaetota bacterium]
MNTADKKPIEFINITDNRELHDLESNIPEVVDHINQKIASFETLSGIIDFLFENIRGIIPCDRLAI